MSSVASAPSRERHGQQHGQRVDHGSELRREHHESRTSSATPNAKYNAPPLSLNSRESPASAVVLLAEAPAGHPIDRIEPRPGRNGIKSGQRNDGTRLK